MAKKIHINHEELDIFYKAVEGSKPLKCNKIRLNPKTNLDYTNKKPKREKDIEFQSHESLELDTVSGEEFIAYKQNSVSNKILRNLRKGQYNVQAKLDLHGMTVCAAKMAVDGFISECWQKQIKVALIIHGKGLHSSMPILKNKLNHWLRSLHVVLAFCSATPKQGSHGAIYVLLKNNQNVSALEIDKYY